MPREYQWAVVDALQANIDGEKVVFFNGNLQLEGKLRNHGKLAEIQKFCNKCGVISFTVSKKRGTASEKSAFASALKYKPDVNSKVFKVVLCIQLFIRK